MTTSPVHLPVQRSGDQPSSPGLTAFLRRELLRLAAREDDLAAQEAATVPYWAPCPSTVLGHRTAGHVLRDLADHLLGAPAEVAS